MNFENLSLMYFYLLLASSLATTLYLIYIFRKKKFCFLKPSILFIMFFNIILQWPSVFYYEEITELLSSSLFGFIAVFSLVPIIVLYVSSSFFFRSVLTIYENIGNPASVTSGVKYCLMAGIFAGFIIYLDNVPIMETGLMAILRGESSQMIGLMREESLKVLPALQRYCFVLVVKVLCPLIVMTTINEYIAYKKNSGKKLSLFAQMIFFITVTVIISSISGARSIAANIFLCIIFYLIFSNKLILKHNLFLKVVSYMVIILSVVTILEYLRSDSKYWVDAIENITNRIFAGTLFPGIFTISLTENYGNWGVGAIPILRDILGVQPIPVANIVANSVFPDSSIKTGLLNASFMMTYYSYLGLIALPLNIVLVLMLDVIPWFIGKLIRPELYCYAVVLYSAPMFTLTMVDYTIIFMSGGILFMILILMAIPKESVKILR